MSSVLNFCCSCEILRKRQAYGRQGKNKNKVLSSVEDKTREGHLYCTRIPSLEKNPTKQQTKSNNKPNNPELKFITS